MSDTKYLATFTAGVLLPGAQAAVTGCAAGVVAGSVAYMAGGDPLTWGALVGGVVFCGAWLGGLAWWRNAISPQPDLSPVALPAETVRVELVTNDGHWVDWLNLPLSLETVTEAARALLGNGYNTSNLGGAGRALTRAQSETLRDWLIKHELATWRRAGAHTAGWDLTPSGRALMRRLAAIDQAPPTFEIPELPTGWVYRRNEQTYTSAQTEATK